MLGKTTLEKAVAAGTAAVQGDMAALPALLAMTDDVDPWFPIVTP